MVAGRGGESDCGRMQNWKGMIFLVAVLGLWARFELKGEEEGKGEEKVLTPAERIEQATKGHELALREYFEKLREAKTDEEKAALVRPDTVAAAREVLETVKMAPDEPGAREAVFWAVRNGGRDRDVLGGALAVVENHYMSAEGVEDLCLILEYFAGPDAVGLLERIKEESEHKPARGAAAFALGRIAAQSGDEEAAAVLYEKVMEGFPDAEVRGKSLSDIAENELFAMRHLKVGKVAPEIEGEKAGGKPFKLSDYRGKVVVLNFFGHW